MNHNEIPSVMRRLKNGPIHVFDGAIQIGGGRTVVERVLPHRDPFLFVDNIVSFNSAEKTLLADKLVNRNDPIFEGHFPGMPMLPAALQIEAIGQAGLCLWSFAENDGQSTDLGLRVTKVEQAQFMRPVLPGDVMSLHAQIIYADDLVVSAAGQVFVGGTLCSILIIKVVIIDG